MTTTKTGEGPRVKDYETTIYCNGILQCIVRKDEADEVLAVLRTCYPNNIYTKEEVKNEKTNR